MRKFAAGTGPSIGTVPRPCKVVPSLNRAEQIRNLLDAAITSKHRFIVPFVECRRIFASIAAAAPDADPRGHDGHLRGRRRGPDRGVHHLHGRVRLPMAAHRQRRT